MTVMTPARDRKTNIRRPASGIAIDPDRLRYMRERRAMDRLQLAEKTGLTRDAIAKIENGARRPKPATLKVLCEALGCEPDELLPEPPPLNAEKP